MIKIQKFSYHCHTTFSDGKNSIEEMVRHAKEIGFYEIGLSDHLIVHKNMKQSKSNAVNKHMREEKHIYNDNFKEILPRFQKHSEEIRRIAKRENFKIYVGYEVDFFTYDGWLEEFSEFLRELDYDYLISGNHFLFDEKCENIINLTDLAKIYENTECYNKFLNRHFQTIAKAMSAGLFSFLAHIDYARRLGDNICAPTMFWEEKMNVLNTLKKENKGIELNTKGLLRVNDFYPSSNIISEIAKRNIAVVISDDAHSTNEQGLNFNYAEEKILEYNINNRLKF